MIKKMIALTAVCMLLLLSASPAWRQDFVGGFKRVCHTVCEKFLSKVEQPGQSLTPHSIRITGDILDQPGALVIFKDSGWRLGANMLLGKGEVARVSSSQARFMMHFFTWCDIPGLSPLTFTGESGTYTVVRIALSYTQGLAAALLGKLDLNNAKVYSGRVQLVAGKENQLSMQDVDETSLQTTVIKNLFGEVKIEG